MQNENLYYGKIQNIKENIKQSKDYYRRYIEKCENPDTILIYHSEIAKKLISNQEIIMDLLIDLYENLKEGSK